MSVADDPVRWTVLFSGMVQGVGFRFTSERVARRFAVDGFVRNLADGRVEVVAEGQPSEVGQFVAALEEAMGGYIRERRCVESPGTGELRGFSIRY